MLRISKKADYAVFLLGAIARQGAYPGGSPSDFVVSAQEIARQAGLNKSVVANLLKEFAKHGILESIRGLRGGYRLVKAPTEVSLGDILEVVEGRFVLVDCVSALPSGGAMNGEGGDAAARRDHNPLAMAKSMQADEAHNCALIAFCPSKHPMRIVHARIAQLFRQIRLDELCSLSTAPPTHRAAPSAGSPSTGSPSTGSPRRGSPRRGSPRKGSPSTESPVHPQPVARP